MNDEPIFASEAQEVFAPPSGRVYLIEAYGPIGEGAEGVYVGAAERDRLAVIDFDTPSGEPLRVAVPFTHVRNLYR